MANVQMDYKDFPLKQCGFSLKLRADSAPVIGPMSALGCQLRTHAPQQSRLVRYRAQRSRLDVGNRHANLEWVEL
jgi:hypothetical protein